MTRRLVRPKRRPYHGFPWTRAAMLAAVAMHSPMLDGPRVTLRTIAADLHARGLVDHKPDAATVRRMLNSPKARELERELALKGTHGKNGLPELGVVGFHGRNCVPGGCECCEESLCMHPEKEGGPQG